MAYEESLRSITLNADDTLAVYTGVPGALGSPSPHYGNQYRFVKLTGARQAGLATDDEDTIIGVMQSKPQVEGQEATVSIRGISNVMSGGALSPGDFVTVDASGRAVKTETKADALGVVIDSTATAENHLASVLLWIN